MKKYISFTLLFFISLIAFSQNYILYVSGHVYELNSPIGVPNHEVYVQTDTTNPGGGNLAVFVTNQNGEYFGEINMNGMPAQGYVTVFTYDCNQQVQSYYLPYFPGAAVTADFYICTDPGQGDCTNLFSYYSPAPYTFFFTGEVYPPANASYIWDFGDGYTGTGQQTEHTYGPNTGDFVTVTLTTISFDPASLDSCFAVSTQEVWIGGQGNDCYNWFQYQTNDYLTFSFEGFSFPDSVNTQYFWEFGDGNTASGPLVTHTFLQGGVAFYNVCLYTYSYSPAGDSCSAVSCQEVYIGNPGGDCQNIFWYDNLGNQTFNFHGESFPVPANQYFWDFGDGTFAYEPEVIHTFEGNSNVYTVCLTTFIYANPSGGDSCTFTSCQEVFVNNTGGCESWFEYQANGLEVTFTGFTNSLLPTTYNWIFENGMVGGTGQEFTYTFPEAGNYMVTLYTIDSSSCESWFSMPVMVEGGGSQVHTLTGAVYMDTIPADYGMAGLFGIGINGTFTFQITQLLNGGFIFENVPEGQYYLVAGLSPESAQFFNYFPTYYGDVLFWLNATIIQLGEPQNPYDIHLVPTSFAFTGPGNISGNVYGGSYKSGGESGVTIMLMNESGTPVGYQSTDENGHYEFSNLNYGTYKVSVEMPGMNSEIATVVLTESSASPEVNFVVEQNQVYLSLDENRQAAELLSLYPNPAIETITVEMNSIGSGQIYFRIYNHMGQMVSSSVKTAAAGFNAIPLQLETLPEGLYTLRAQSENGMLFTTKFLKSR